MSSPFTVESAASWVEEAVGRIPDSARERLTIETRGEAVYVSGYVTEAEFLRYTNRYIRENRAFFVYYFATDALRFYDFIYDENQANNYFNHVLEMYAPF